MAPFYPLISAATAAAGLSYGDPATRAAYLARQYPGDTPDDARSMGSSQYGCLLHARACLREAGLDGTCLYRGKEIDVLRCAYAPYIGQIQGLIETLARHHGWYATDDLADVQPADLLVVGEGTSTHGLVVVGTDGATVYSVDGGQTDPQNAPHGTAIKACQRTLGARAGQGVWLGDRRVQCRIRL